MSAILRKRKKRYAMAMDMRKCVGCNACVLACKAENDVPEGGFRCWVEIEIRGAFPDLKQRIVSSRCMHCADAPCVSNCPTGASFYSEGGAVQVDPDKCTGCKACIAACPYGARFVRPEGYVDKCTFCMHRVAKGKDPACVEVCPTESLVFGDLGDPESSLAKLLARRQHETLKPEQGTEPHLFFLS
ncbi:MAG: 4Fe-4S dicluster domain-containing protein [Myxococcales bacterium]|nr:4Fe-4S dicluster domain-containing protein [Myxococcales bacterium]